ncbi:MAG: hypothetical protein J3Q66DRAFT_323405 [Benniella sp.]|nr:MAG: hypothetical protein J3Q66DRAFT_323405 [Benniella sp.]
MESDQRTSARDLLTLAQKVSTVLQRHSDKLLGEIEGAQGSLAPEKEELLSEQSQQALEVRRQVWESTKSLKNALEHVEDIEDEDEPRILQESIDDLQAHVRKGLKIVSDAESKNNNTGIRKEISSSAIDAPQSSTSTSAQMAVGMMAPGPSSLVGSMNRHPLGLFSTSPQFTVKAPFASSARMPIPRFTTAGTAGSIGSESGEPVSSSMGSLDPLKPSPAPKSSTAHTSPTPRKQAAKSTVIAVDEGPLSIPVSPKASPQRTRSETCLDPATSTAKTSYLVNTLVTPSSKPTTTPDSTSNHQSGKQTDGDDKAVPKKPDPPFGSSQKRRVPRGLFSLTATSEADPVRPSGLDHGLSSSSTDNVVESQGFSQNSLTNWRDEHSENRDALTNPHSEAPQMRSPRLSSEHSAGDSPTQSSSSRPQSPESPPTSTFSSPTASEAKSPESPLLPRSQSKPLPIQTTGLHGTSRTKMNGVNSKAHQEDEETAKISQLERELERAMNPTPTDPVPQPYFLQGKGLLQRIPSHVSMDDGLLDDEDGQRSEELDGHETQEPQEDGSDPLRSNGQLRRRGSGGRRQFRISRSRSRNRSKGRQESRNRQTTTPIEVYYHASLSSSEWPFDRSPPRGRSMVSPSSSQRRRDHTSPSSNSYSTSSSEWQTKAGPRLPFAESVTVGNPIRVGKGIGSFTIYSIALKLCDPVQSALAQQAPVISSRCSGDYSMEEQNGGASRRRAGHASEESITINTQYPNNNNLRTEEGLEVSSNDTRTEHHHPLLTKSPSKAALMMTRSFSFPELGSSAEQLLVSMQLQDELPPSLSIDTTSPALADSRQSPRGSEGLASTTNPRNESGSTSTKAPERIIHVRKRYSDFVILRAQLVQMLRGPGRIQGRNRQTAPQLQSSSSLQTAVSSSRSTSGTANSNRSRNGENYDDEEEDMDDDDVVAISHSRNVPGTATPGTGVLCRSILRGMPKLPPKKVVGKFRPAFIEKRRRELEYFLEWVVAHPIVGDCPVVVQWFLGGP